MKSTLVAFGWNVSCLKRSCRKRIAKSEACRDARERRILLKITPRRRDLQKNFYDQRKKVIIFSIDGLIVDIEWIPVRWSVGGAGRCDPLNNQSLCRWGVAREQPGRIRLLHGVSISPRGCIRMEGETTLGIMPARIHFAAIYAIYNLRAIPYVPRPRYTLPFTELRTKLLFP